MHLKRFINSIAGTILGLALLPGTSMAQSVPNLQQGMTYAQARQMLIDRGWQAILIPPLQRQGELSGLENHIANELGYGEMEACAGTGLGLCRLVFTAADGHKLAVFTANNQQEPTLYGWQLE